MNKKNYLVTLQGCDDRTVLEITLLDEQYEFLKSISEKSLLVSTSDCMPVLLIEEFIRKEEEK